MKLKINTTTLTNFSFPTDQVAGVKAVLAGRVARAALLMAEACPCCCLCICMCMACCCTYPYLETVLRG